MYRRRSVYSVYLGKLFNLHRIVTHMRNGMGYVNMTLFLLTGGHAMADNAHTATKPETGASWDNAVYAAHAVEPSGIQLAQATSGQKPAKAKPLVVQDIERAIGSGGKSGEDHDPLAGQLAMRPCNLDRMHEIFGDDVKQGKRAPIEQFCPSLLITLATMRPENKAASRLIKFFDDHAFRAILHSGQGRTIPNALHQGLYLMHALHKALGEQDPKGPLSKAGAVDVMVRFGEKDVPVTVTEEMAAHLGLAMVALTHGYQKNNTYYHWDKTQPAQAMQPLSAAVVAGRDLWALMRTVYDDGQNHGVLPAMAAGEHAGTEVYGLPPLKRPTQPLQMGNL